MSIGVHLVDGGGIGMHKAGSLVGDQGKHLRQVECGSDMGRDALQRRKLGHLLLQAGVCLFVEAGVLNCDSYLPRYCLEEPDAVLAEVSLFVRMDCNHAEKLLFSEEDYRHGEH